MAARPSKLTPHLAAVKAALAVPGTTTQAVADRYGVSRTTLRDFMRKHKLEVAEVRAPDPGKPVDRVETLEQENSELKKRLRRTRKDDVKFERVLNEIRSAVQAPAPRFEPAPLTGSKRAHHTQALLLSDLHGGEVVDPASINGLNEYNWDICVERMEHIHRSLLSFQAARSYPIEELQLWMLGDMCSGANHLEISETNEFTEAEQAQKVGLLLGKFVEDLVPAYSRIKIACVPGNHPRARVKPAAKQVWNNWDWTAYQFAQIWTRNYESVTWDVARAGTIVQPIAGLNYLLLHGDGIRSTMPGVPWGGIVRRTNELSRTYKEQGINLDGFGLAHFHTPNVIQGGRIIVNGAVKGTDEWVQKQFGGGHRPTQILLTFDERRKRLTDDSYITP